MTAHTADLREPPRGEPTEIRLPGGWLVRHTSGSVELLDPAGAGVCTVTGRTRAALTIEHAWRGLSRDGGPRWWAVAIGRAGSDAPVRVSFTGRRPRSRQRDRTAGALRTVAAQVVTGELWVAAVHGLQVAVTCAQGGRQLVRPVVPLPGRRPQDTQDVDA